MTPDPLTFAKEALGCREHTGYDTCVEHGGPTWPCEEAVRVAAIIEERDREIRADECEQVAALVRARVTADHGTTHGRAVRALERRAITRALRERAAQHRGDKP